MALLTTLATCAVTGLGGLLVFEWQRPNSQFRQACLSRLGQFWAWVARPFAKTPRVQASSRTERVEPVLPTPAPEPAPPVVVAKPTPVTVLPVHAPGLSVLAGNLQIVQQHSALAQPLSVRLCDDAGQPVAGAQVVFFARDGSGPVRGGPRSTDATGIARWEGYLHTGGQQWLCAAATGFPPVTFEITVTPHGQPQDGIYDVECEPRPGQDKPRMYVLQVEHGMTVMQDKIYSKSPFVVPGEVEFLAYISLDYCFRCRGVTTQAGCEISLKGEAQEVMMDKPTRAAVRLRAARR